MVTVTATTMTGCDWSVAQSSIASSGSARCSESQTLPASNDYTRGYDVLF